MYPKILFGISLIIGLSIIIMVVLVGGLLVWNDLLTTTPTSTPTSTKSTIPITQQVTIATDKTEYEQGEEIHFTLKNNSGVDVFLTQMRCTDKIEDAHQGGEHSAWPNLQVLKNNKWEDIHWHYFPADATAAKCISSLECVSNIENIKFNEIPTKFIGQLLKPGKYRIELEFGLSCQRNIGLKEIFVAYSNEFTIKKK